MHESAESVDKIVFCRIILSPQLPEWMRARDPQDAPDVVDSATAEPAATAADVHTDSAAANLKLLGKENVDEPVIKVSALVLVT